MEGDLCVGNSLISMYAKCGSTRDAEAVFQGLREERDVVSWSAMVAAYGASRDADMAVRCFERMRGHGIRPDAVAFACVLNACRHAASLASRGRAYFHEMEEAERSAQHYACLVDFLAKSGQLTEAERLLALLPVAVASSSSEKIRAALLSACRAFGDLEMGRRCFEALVATRPRDAAWYVLMADLYSRSGRMEDAWRIEEMRRQRCARKKPASALIELSDEQVHEFVVGSRSSRSGRELVDLFNSRLQAEGHVPDLDLVPRKATSDASKASLLCAHAEKLAIAFGLLHTAPGETLRVTKNLRMCGDCHDATKIISRIEKREIIVRDTCCVHHFRNGSCSCADIF
jgi:pentatricopeptide repeat protein